jgi:uncharacterized OB-fold protein
MKIWPYENVYYRVKNNIPYLIASRCRNCGHVSFPKKEVCPACVTRDNSEEIELSRTGKIDTFSVLYVGAPGFSIPYVVGYVKMPEGPRAFSIIQKDKVSEDAIKVGQEVELVLGKIRADEKGNDVMGFQFRCADGK